MKPLSSICAFTSLLSLLTGCGSGIAARDPSKNSSSNSDDDAQATALCEGDPTFTTYQAASYVIGQGNFDDSAADRGQAGPVANGLNNPYGVPAFSPGMIWIPDFGNHRVLGYAAIPYRGDDTADVVIGQSAFTTGSSGLSSTALHGPIGVGYDGTSLFVLETDNQRVLRYSTLPSSNGAAASQVVVGGPDFTTVNFNCDATSMGNAEGFRVSNGKLIVPDASNHRVLIWNTVPSSSGTPADLVLGQSNFTTCTTSGSTSASSVSYPADAATDGTRLAIADLNLNRVLIWNTFPTSNQQPADIVIGQPDMSTVTSNTGGISARSLYNPLSVEIHGGKLYVSDAGNSRVLIWNTFPTQNYQAADVVLGQENFTTAVETSGQRRLNGAAGVRVCGNQLFVGQDGGNRYSVFEGQ